MRIGGVYEYCGVPRCGKSTMMVKDLVSWVLANGRYDANKVWCNFVVDISGVHCLETEELIEQIFKIKASEEREHVMIFDEVGQFFMARSYKDRRQTDAVTFAWQIPKRGHILMYGSNVGNSADVILRDATQFTIMPRYFHGDRREDDYIEFALIKNYYGELIRGIRVPHVYRYQELFRSFEAIN